MPRRLLPLLALLALAPAGWSASPEVWSAMHSGRLAASFDRDPEQAIAVYEALLEDLPSRDPQRGWLLLALGQAHLQAGEPELSRAALTAAATLPACRSEAEDALDLLDVWSQRVTVLPYTALPDVRIRRGDQWRLAFDDLQEPVREVRIRLRAEGAGTVMRIELESFDGRRLPSLDAIEIPADSWLELPLDMSDFRSVLSNAPPAQEGDRRLWMLTLQPLQEAVNQDVSVHIAEVEVR